MWSLMFFSSFFLLGCPSCPRALVVYQSWIAEAICMGFAAYSTLQTNNDWKHENVFRSTFPHHAKFASSKCTHGKSFAVTAFNAAIAVKGRTTVVQAQATPQQTTQPLLCAPGKANPFCRAGNTRTGGPPAAWGGLLRKGSGNDMWNPIRNQLYHLSFMAHRESGYPSVFPLPRPFLREYETPHKSPAFPDTVWVSFWCLEQSGCMYGYIHMYGYTYVWCM